MPARWGHIVKLLSGPLLGAVVYWSVDFGGPSTDIPDRVAALAIWMAVWWITEAVHLAVTALLPVFLFPLLGILDTQDVAVNYMNQVIFLFIGGFLLAIAIEKWNLHQRIALRILMAVGSSPPRILLGFMLAAYLLSMWISNTATVMMLLPAAMAVLAEMDACSDEAGRIRSGSGLLLGLAYAGSLGGTATLIGTAPNMIFLSYYETNFEAGFMHFARWMAFGLPLSALFMALVYGLLYFLYFSGSATLSMTDKTIREKYAALGPVTHEEKVVMAVFFTTVLLWLFRADIGFGDYAIPGWSNLLPFPEYVYDSTVAMMMAILLFLIPARHASAQLMNWDDAAKLPFGIIFLFGGGFALAEGVQTSGLTEWMTERLTMLQGAPPVLVIAGLCAFMTFTTELTSNTASTQLVMPVLIALSEGMQLHPLLIMVPVTFSASFAFMLPVATPPNTIIFGSKRISIPTMAKTGIWLNLAGVLLITAMMLTLGRWVFEVG